MIAVMPAAMPPPPAAIAPPPNVARAELVAAAPARPLACAAPSAPSQTAVPFAIPAAAPVATIPPAYALPLIIVSLLRPVRAIASFIRDDTACPDICQAIWQVRPMLSRQPGNARRMQIPGRGASGARG